jgi:mRNA-degrading endonuclease RelE of RelBE toxin-antitoxin system
MTEVIVLSYFVRLIKELRKKFPNVSRDVDPLIEELERGETPGDRIQGVSPYIVYKVRRPNRDARRGKSGGYRVIYYVKTSEKVYLLIIYSKAETEDITPDEIIRVIKDAEIDENDA